MADVACFCGCYFSFEGGAGACPSCGEVASLTGDPAPASAGRMQPQTAALVMDWAGLSGNGPLARLEQEPVEAESADLPDIVIGALAGALRK